VEGRSRAGRGTDSEANNGILHVGSILGSIATTRVWVIDAALHSPVIVRCAAMLKYAISPSICAGADLGASAA